MQVYSGNYQSAVVTASTSILKLDAVVTYVPIFTTIDPSQNLTESPFCAGTKFNTCLSNEAETVPLAILTLTNKGVSLLHRKFFET